MVIHRVGPLPDTAPTRQPLGRVLVTIDDLEALMVILRQKATDPDSIKVQFNGGYCTAAEDIRLLSDNEVKSLKILSDNAEVILEPTQALAVGQVSLTSTVRNAWSRTRQTDIEPDRKYMSSSAKGSITGCITVIGLAAFSLANVGQRQIAATLAIMAVCAALFGLFVWIFFTNLRVARSMPGALIKPMSLHEYRQLRSNNQYPRAAWIVAIIAVIVAIAAIVVPVMTAKP